MKPAAVLVASLKIHHGILAAVDLALDAGEAGKLLRVLPHARVRRAGVEPDVENVVALLPAVLGVIAEEALARAVGVPRVSALVHEGFRDPQIDGLVAQDIDRD